MCNRHFSVQCLNIQECLKNLEEIEGTPCTNAGVYVILTIFLMKIKTEISFKEYRKLLFSLTYRKPIMKVILCVAFVMLVWILGYYLHFLPVPKPQIYQYTTLILITVVQPITIYWTIKRNYDSSNHLREHLEIELTQSEIKVQGESF